MEIQKYLDSGILEQYVLGLTSPEENQQIEQYIQKYPVVRRKIRKLQSCMEHYAKLHEIPPPKNLKNKILSKIEDIEECKALSIEYRKKLKDVPQHLSAGPSRFSGLASAVAALLIFSLAALSVILYQKQNKANQQLAKLQGDIENLQTNYQQLNRKSSQLQSQFAVLKDAGTQHVHLRGTDMSPSAWAIVYYNPSHKKSFINVLDMPEAPHGHQYQLWADVNGQHINLGALAPALNGDSLHVLPFMDQSKGFAVTLEEVGESRTPTVSKMCMSGKIY